MLTQEPPPHPKCKLNMSSFLTLPHLSDCLICTRNCMCIVFLLKMVGGRNRWGVVALQQGVGGGTGPGYSLLVCFCLFHLCFCPLFSHVLCPFVLTD